MKLYTKLDSFNTKNESKIESINEKLITPEIINKGYYGKVISAVNSIHNDIARGGSNATPKEVAIAIAGYLMHYYK